MTKRIAEASASNPKEEVVFRSFSVHGAQAISCSHPNQVDAFDGEAEDLIDRFSKLNDILLEDLSIA